MDRVLTDTHIPASFKDVTFQDFDTKRRSGTASLLRQIEDWTPTDSKPGLFMQGPPNVGKTMLACALENDYHAQFPMKKVPDDGTRTYLRQERLPIYFIQVAEFIALQIRSFKLYDLAMKGLDTPDEYLEIDQLLQDLHYRVKVLVLDDVGKEHRTPTGYAEDAFDLLVRTRHNAGLATIYTTNVKLRDWSLKYSESMQSLIERSSLVLTF